MTGAPPPPPPPPDGRRPPAPPPPPPPPGAMPPMPPGAPGFATAPKSGTNGMAIAALVLGILSIPLCFLFVPGVLGIVFGLIALSQIKNNPGQSGRGQAITGVILGAISLVFIIVMFVAVGSADFQFDTQMTIG